MGALLPKNGRNLLVSRVSEWPPHSKMRGEPAWGVHLAGTAENSGPNPKPIKLMERFQQTAGTRGTVSLLTQHISVSPQGSCTDAARGPPGGGQESLQLVQPGPCALDIIPLEPGLWGPGVPPQAVTVALLIQPATSPSLHLPAAPEDLASLFGASSQQGGQRGHPSAHTSASLCLCGRWHLHCWHRQDMSRN